MTGFPGRAALRRQYQCGHSPYRNPGTVRREPVVRAEGMGNDRELFAWNGKYSQYMSVNIRPRPFQTPHPPVSITPAPGKSKHRPIRPAAGTSDSTSLSSPVPRQPPERIFDDLWRMADELGVDDNPFRANYAQHVLVALTSSRGGAALRRTRCLQHDAGDRSYPDAPLHAARGHQSARSSCVAWQSQMADGHPSEPPSFGQLVESGAIVAGSVATVVSSSLIVPAATAWATCW